MKCYYRINNMRKQKKKVSFSKYFQASQNQSYTYSTQSQIKWENCQGNVCKIVIGPNRCFCKHSFEQHDAKNKFVCSVQKCGCSFFQYVPYFDMKCMCRHSYKEHDKVSRKCKMCNKCLGFLTSWSCKCGFKFDQHRTILGEEVMNNTFRSTEKVREGKQTFYIRNKENNNKNHNVPSVKDRKGLYMAERFETLPISKQEGMINSDRDKKNALDRVNRKYAKLNEKIENNLTLTWNRKLQPIHKQNIGAMDLYMKPHNYRYVNIEKLLEHEYKKNKINIYYNHIL